jgi:hypothetical protein
MDDIPTTHSATTQKKIAMCSERLPVELINGTPIAPTIKEANATKNISQNDFGLLV